MSKWNWTLFQTTERYNIFRLHNGDKAVEVLYDRSRKTFVGAWVEHAGLGHDPNNLSKNFEKSWRWFGRSQRRAGQAFDYAILLTSVNPSDKAKIQKIYKPI